MQRHLVLASPRALGLPSTCTWLFFRVCIFVVHGLPPSLMGLCVYVGARGWAQQVKVLQVAWHCPEGGKNDPVLAMDFHPTAEPPMLATAGTDCEVKVRALSRGRGAFACAGCWWIAQMFFFF